MSTSKAFQIYSRLPVFMQNIACSIVGIKMLSQRYNSTFKEAFVFLTESEWWNSDKLQNYQNKQLRDIIQYSYKNIPYYHELFDQCNVKPEDIQTTKDLVKLPILTKQIIRERWADLQSSDPSLKNRNNNYTGGTTGTALKITTDNTTQPWQWAIWWRHRNRFGIKLNNPFIVFAGRDVVPLNTMRQPIWRRNLPMHQTYVSIHHLTQNNLPILSKYLCSRNVSYYSGYPSSLYTVASYFKENKIRLPFPPKIVFTGAETLLPHQRSTIEEGFSTKVSDQYGATEQCGNISECEKHRYHVDMEFGAVEFLPIKGMPSNVRRILCTGFHNLAMPLIRYDIGDIATLSEETCSCGRQSPVIDKIDGRIESYIITPDGRRLGRLDFLFKKSPNILEAQLIQDTIDCVRFCIVRTSEYTNADEQQLITTIHEYMGHSFTIKIEYLDEIPRGKNGKFRQIISTVFKDTINKE